MKKYIYKKSTSMRLSKNFSLSEFACPCRYCTDVYFSDGLVKLLQHLRDHFGTSITINSAFRCTHHNTQVGGSKNSQHMLGNAADIVVQGILPVHVQRYLIINQAKLGVTIGRYDTFTHVDVRDVPVTFDKRTK